MVVTVSLGWILKAIGTVLLLAFLMWALSPPKNGGKK